MTQSGRCWPQPAAGDRLMTGLDLQGRSLDESGWRRGRGLSALPDEGNGRDSRLLSAVIVDILGRSNRTERYDRGRRLHADSRQCAGQLAIDRDGASHHGGGGPRHHQRHRLLRQRRRRGPRLDLPPLNGTTSRERFCQCQNQRRAFHATRKERTGVIHGGRSGFHKRPNGSTS